MEPETEKLAYRSAAGRGQRQFRLGVVPIAVVFLAAAYSPAVSSLAVSLAILWLLLLPLCDLTAHQRRAWSPPGLPGSGQCGPRISSLYEEEGRTALEDLNWLMPA